MSISEVRKDLIYKIQSCKIQMNYKFYLTEIEKRKKLANEGNKLPIMKCN
jgi:hypothetical protein